MQGLATPLLYKPCSSSIPLSNPNPNPNPNLYPWRINNQQRLGSGRCMRSSAAAAASLHENSGITEYNLYELLGIDASSDTSQIKAAYRALQKRCHPDIAGPPGHDMAIVLNEAYALLCDPVSRMAYDKELAKFGDLQGYTGKPIYSVWVGSESEERAVFVDEVKCVGCLKCALFADKTFAIESVYGRARVVAQWADPEPNIQQAIAACPVDCISIVERSELAALEFIMSKQPRGRVRIGAGNTAGVRTADVFDEVEKFKARYDNHNASKNYSKESQAHRGIRAIQVLSNWLYWNSPIASDAAPLATQNWKAAHTTTYDEATVKKLKAAVAARKSSTTSTTPAGNSTEYWQPLALELPTTPTPTPTPTPNSKDQAHSPQMQPRPETDRLSSPIKRSSSPLRWGLPMGAAIMAATVVRQQQLGDAVGGALENHVGGSLALAIVNSSWTQLALAAATWYLIVMYLVELVETATRKKKL